MFSLDSQFRGIEKGPDDWKGMLLGVSVRGFSDRVH